MKKLKPIKNTLIILSLGINCLIIIICFTPLTEALYKPLIVNEPPQKCDVIVILAAGANREGFLGYRSMNRIEKGVSLYRKNLADKILCAGGDWYDVPGKSIGDLMKEKLIFYNIPEEAVLVQDVPKRKMKPMKSLKVNTYSDLKDWYKKIQEKQHIKKSIFVTSSYHTYRVRKILDKLDINGIVISVEPYELLPMKLSSRLELFREIMREYSAILFFLIKGYI